MTRRFPLLFLLPLLAFSGCGDREPVGTSVDEHGPALTLEEGQCDWGGIYPQCTQPPGTGIECPALDPNCSGGGIPQTPDGPTGPGGGEENEPDPEQPDTCNTGNALLDDEDVQAGFSTLWEQSNPDAAQSERREAGGWIVTDGVGGYDVVPMTDVTAGPCSLTPHDGYAPNPPANAVGWVHTHPFEFNEPAVSCAEFNYGGNGMIVSRRYPGTASADDAIIGDRINTRLAAMGKQPVDGYVLDKDGIQRFRPVGLNNGGKIDYRTIKRCGY